MIITIDTETTGLDPNVDRIVEIAAVARRSSALFLADTLCDPERDIPPVSRAVHHIGPEDIKGMPKPNDGFAQVLRGVTGDDDDEIILAAHNAEFDRGFISRLAPEYADASRWIDTYRCALHLFPDAPSHSNQVLRYWLELDVNLQAVPNLFPHRALFDCLITHALVEKMLSLGTSEQELVALSTKPVVLRKVGFGKHYGEEWSKVPTSYLEWVVKQDMKSDVKHTALHHLETRAAATTQSG